MSDEQNVNTSKTLEKIRGKIEASPTAFPEDDEVQQEVVKLMLFLESCNIELLPYIEYTEYIYFLEDDETNRELPENLLRIVENIDKDHESFGNFQNAKIKFEKILRHMELALLQRTSLYEQQNREIHDLKTQLNEAEDKVKVFSENADSITTQFITILGVFAAIIMAAFGSVQGLSSIFQNTGASIGRLIIQGSIIGSFLILIIFYLMNSITKIIRRDISRNNSANAIKKHPALFSSLALMVITGTLGGSIELASNGISMSWGFLWLLLPIGSVLLLWLLYFLYTLWIVKEE